jgi:hypothetical protein
MHQQLWRYKVEWKSVSRGTAGKRLNTTGIDDTIKKWKPTINPGIKLQGNIYLNSLLYADDLTIIHTNEDDLQRSIF